MSTRKAYGPEGPPGAEIELHGVSFPCHRARPALGPLTLRIAVGERVALVDFPGTGTITLDLIVAGLRNPGAGRVRIEGRDASECSDAWLRSQVGLLGPPPAPPAKAVIEAIAGGTGASREAVVAAAKSADAHGFVSELPEHYETPLGVVELSAGQGQRLAVARAIVRDPRILVLDEPTAGLDAGSEARVVEALLALMAGRTTIILTRSAALASHADRVLRMKDGRVTKEGPPAEVLAGVRDGMTVAAPVPRNAALPADPALPALHRLLDPQAMAPVLRRSLEPGAEAPAVRLKNVRYKPGASLVVHYDVGIDRRWHHAVARLCPVVQLDRRAARARSLALAARAERRSPARRPLRFEPELGALIQWLPLDLSLPALAEPPMELARALRGKGVEVPAEEPLLLAYRPRRRAVLRLGHHVLKVYCTEDHFRGATAGLRASSSLLSLRTPAFEAALPELRMTAQSAIDGSPPAHDRDTVLETAGLLRKLHRSRIDGLPRSSPRAQLGHAAATVALAGVLVPGLRAQLEHLLERLESTLPDVRETVPSHGDFHPRQVIRDERGPAIIDFDAMCQAPAAFDLAHYAAHLVRGGRRDGELAQHVLAQLAEGYGESPAHLRWHLATAILRRVAFPFRYLDDDWPERVRHMVATAATVTEAPGGL